MSGNSLTLTEIIERISASNLAEVRISIPAKVVTYDPITQSCSVQPLIKERVEDETGEWQLERLPVIPGVPVCFPRGGGMHLTFPISIGDTGLVVFSDASLDTWLSEGGEVDPGEPRSFGINDAVFLPGMRPFKGGVPVSNAHVSIGADGGEEFKAVIGETLRTFLDELRTYIGTLPVTAAGATYAPSAVPVVPAASLLLSSSVKVTR